MTKVHMRLNLQTPSWSTPPSELYPVSLEMARWADDQGLDAIRIGEHHATEDNWCPSTIALGSAVAAVTRHITIMLSAYLLPLHHPIQAAEDLAVLDLISQGRLHVALGAGYRADEFALFGVDPLARGQMMEEAVATVRRAWSGEALSVGGRTMRITPAPFTPGGPPLTLAGSSPRAARRAVRLGLDFFPTNSEAYDAFQKARVAAGLGQAPPYARSGPHMVHVARDVDAAWEQLAPYAVHEARTYSEWADDPSRPDAGDLRRGGRYVVATPEECVAMAERLGPDGILTLHPLVSGLPPRHAWESLKTFGEEVLPLLRKSESPW